MPRPLEPCPNPTCRRPDLVRRVKEAVGHSTRFFVVCQSCGMRGPECWMAFAESQATVGKAEVDALWNALPRETEVSDA